MNDTVWKCYIGLSVISVIPHIPPPAAVVAVPYEWNADKWILLIVKFPMCDKLFFEFSIWNQAPSCREFKSERIISANIATSSSVNIYGTLHIRSMVIWYMHVPSAVGVICIQSLGIFRTRLLFFSIRFGCLFLSVAVFRSVRYQKKKPAEQKKGNHFCNTNHTTAHENERLNGQKWKAQIQWKCRSFSGEKQMDFLYKQKRNVIFFSFAYLLGHNIRTWIAIPNSIGIYCIVRAIWIVYLGNNGN